MPNDILYRERKSRGWTQSQLAEKLNAVEADAPKANRQPGAATADMVRKWERGKHQPSPFYIERLCRLFECTADHLGFGAIQAPIALRNSMWEIQEKATCPQLFIEASDTPLFVQTLLQLPSSLAMVLETEDDWPTWFAVKQTQILTMVGSWNGRAALCHELQFFIDQEIKMLNEMRPQGDDEVYALSRRQAVIAIAAYPLALLASFRQSSPSVFIIEELLSRCAASITASWHLLKGSELAVVDHIVSGYLPVLIQMVQLSSRYQKTAARLVTQGYRLKGIVALHQNNVKAREAHCQQALHYSEISEDPSSIVAALISLASTSYYDKNPKKASSIYQRALSHINAIPPLQQARLSVELAVVYAQQRQEKEALHFLELSQKAYPDRPEDDPSFLYAEFTPASMILEEGLTYLALAQHYPHEHADHAWETFFRIEQPQARGVIPQRIFYEITNQQAETALVLGDQERFHAYLEKGVQGAALLSSKQRRREAIDAYKKAQVLWPGEPHITELAELFL